MPKLTSQSYTDHMVILADSGDHASLTDPQIISRSHLKVLHMMTSRSVERSSRNVRELVFTLLVAGASFLQHGCSQPPDPKMPVERTVMVTPVDLADGATSRYSGILQAADRSDLAFEISGSVRTIHVDLGDRIERGQSLAELDDKALRLELRAQQANLQHAQADLRGARLDYERRAALAGTGATSPSAVDQAEARFDRARAQVEALKAQVAQAEKRLADTQLIAPFSGEIVARLAEPSEYVGAGQSMLRAIGDRHRLEAVIHIPGRARRDLDKGQRVQLSIPHRGISANGFVTEVGAQANRAGLFPVTVNIESNGHSLRPGESVEALWGHEGQAQSLLIPLTAYVPVGDGLGQVFVVERRDGKARVVARNVKLGALRTHHIEVLSGLEHGELIVRKGVDLLEDGEPVQTAGVGLARYNQ
ncbi:efflux RND transporter periplasmic adaptor subunit [Zobellella sp. DQSA1]|uniref:efflux RND transporter periplasmic adaptor subunit n=1 Tax=Zobellella sp. DQSA1 TaxID=3342386 RepID=UPI0035BF26BD